MRERPILFSGPLVRALLDGRKTETRRPVRFTSDLGPWTWAGWPCDGAPGYAHPERRCEAPGPGRFHGHFANGFHHEGRRCPYGVPGDRLWVREGLERVDDGLGYPYEVYRADRATVGADRTDLPAQWTWKRSTIPSIHMPRRASRITLEVTDVRVERIQAIDPVGAKAEGIPSLHRFRALWESIYQGRKDRPGLDWDSNPWVWVVAFERVTP